MGYLIMQNGEIYAAKYGVDSYSEMEEQDILRQLETKVKAKYPSVKVDTSTFPLSESDYQKKAELLSLIYQAMIVLEKKKEGKESLEFYFPSHLIDEQVGFYERNYLNKTCPMTAYQCQDSQFLPVSVGKYPNYEIYLHLLDTYSNLEIRKDDEYGNERKI